jgi:hypothetical protein
MKDSAILFSSIGYHRTNEKLPQRNRPYKEHIVKLRPNSIMLNEVVVHGPQSMKVARLGWMGGKDGILPLDTLQGGGAVAMLVEAPLSPCFVEKMQLRLMYNSKDTAVFRFHIFEYDSIQDSPGKELLNQEILLKGTKRFGWLRFDLSAYLITLSTKKFFIGFEWIDERESRKAMIKGIHKWEAWKKDEFHSGNSKVERISSPSGIGYKYHGNMMNWPGFKELPPFTGLMVESGKNNETKRFRTFERKTSFGKWTELDSTLNAVITIRY